MNTRVHTEQDALRWRPIESAPKDGTHILAYLYQTGIRVLRWMTPQECAQYEGSTRVEDYDGVWVQVDDEDEGWSPRWWLPADALPPPPSDSPKGQDGQLRDSQEIRATVEGEG